MADDTHGLFWRAQQQGWSCHRVMHARYGDVWEWGCRGQVRYTAGTTDPTRNLPPFVLASLWDEAERPAEDPLLAIKGRWDGLPSGPWDISEEYGGGGISITDGAGRNVLRRSGVKGALESAPDTIPWLIAEVERLRHEAIPRTSMVTVDRMARGAVADAIQELCEIQEWDEVPLSDEDWGLLEKLVANNVCMALYHAGLVLPQGPQREAPAPSEEGVAVEEHVCPVWPDDAGGPAREWLGLIVRGEPRPLAAFLPAESTLWYDELGRPTTTEPAIGIPAGNPVFVTTDSKRRRGTAVSAVSARARDGATIRLSPRYDHARIHGKRLTLVHAIYGDHSGLLIDASEPCGAGLVYRCHAEGEHWFWRMGAS